MQIEGSNGVVILEDDKLRIRRKGVAVFLTQGFQGEKTIPLSSIRAVQFKAATGWMAGYIQFTLVGSFERPGGIFEATEDENAVLFDKPQQPDFEQLRDKIKAAIAAGNGAMPPRSAADEIEKLAGLLDRGLLTREEFDAQKQALLR